MTTSPEEIDPCVRGCQWEPATEGEAPRPKGATHGLLCGSCFYRLKHALELIPDLMANMRAQIVPGGAAQGERVQGGGDGSPAPLRIGPLDASDSLYAKLVSWTEVIGGALHVPQPRVAVWINMREVQGSRPVSVEDAHRIADALVGWFTDHHLEQIAELPLAAAFHDDICYGWEEARGVFSLAAAYGVEPRPVAEAEKRECPVCGFRDVFVAWPDKFDPDVRVLCARCQFVVDPDLVNAHGRATGTVAQQPRTVEKPLPDVPRRCSGSKYCTATEHHPRCYSLEASA